MLTGTICFVFRVGACFVLRCWCSADAVAAAAAAASACRLRREAERLFLFVDVGFRGVFALVCRQLLPPEKSRTPLLFFWGVVSVVFSPRFVVLR